MHDVPTPRRLIVLAIDDQVLVLTAIGQLLASEADVDYHRCSDPCAAVAVANRVRPSVILQDLVMPGVDGITLLRDFHHNESTRMTPVIVLSGNSDRGARERALAQGAVDYLVKLPSRAQLLASIRRHAAASTNNSGTDPSAAQPEARDEAVTLDAGVLGALAQPGDPGASGFIRMLIDQFLDEGKRLVMGLTVAAEQSDPNALALAAHSLKGSARTIGANKLGALAAQMERHAPRPARGAVVPALMAQIDQEFRRVQDALAAERERVGKP